MRRKRKTIRSAAGIFSAAVICFFGTCGYYSERLPAAVVKKPCSELSFAEFPEISCYADNIYGENDGHKNATLSLFGTIPVKNINIDEREAPVVAVGGHPFGIKLLMDGVMVTELGDVIDGKGQPICPAESSGIEKGDIIKTADGEPVCSNRQLHELIAKSNGRDIAITAERGGKGYSVMLKPVYSPKNHTWRGGMWVRDSIAGIGTMTFIDEKTGKFAGLGHPICDSDTGEIVPISSGEAVPVEITGVKRGEKGVPGELSGCFSGRSCFGILNSNASCGVGGSLSKSGISELCADAKRLEIGYRQDIVAGEAEIYTTINGTHPQSYSIEIESVDLGSGSDTKNMVIKITDDELIAKTGGIVQGMSGSPIVQNGKLIGAVTHVFIGDPTRGYAVFVENMLN